MYRTKSIDEIYDEVRDFDIVITNDAPLATALNGRIDRPYIGGFAYTPRQLAAELSMQILGEPLMSDLEVVATVAYETGYGLKYVHGEIENIRNIRNHTSEVSRHLYSRLSRNVFDSYSALPTIEKAMDMFVPESYHEKSRAGVVISENIFLGKKVAVVGLDLFNDLDKHFVPIGHEEIDIVTYNEEFRPDVIYEVGNDRQIAENIVELIDEDLANDIAIVMDTESEIADAVRAALYRRNIPFKNTMTVRDLSQIRDYLRFLNFGILYDTVRVRHVRELFSSYGGSLWSKYDNVLLSRLQDVSGKGLELKECLKNIRDMTFLEVCDLVVRERHRPQVRLLLDELKFSDLKVTAPLVTEMNYAVDNVSDLHHNEQIPDSEKNGVLLADCNRSMFVDRPFVAFLGMGNGWSNKITGKSYIDKEAEAEKDAMKFRVLLQQGTSRIYAVNSTKNGKPARPTLLFDGINELEGRRDTVTSFSDVAEVKKGSWYVEEPEIFPERGTEYIDNDLSGDWKFSKSTYNNYCECPRAFYYGNLLMTPDSEATAFGNHIHDFAEMYVCYPDIVKEKGIEYYVEHIGNVYAGLSCPMMEEVDLDRIRIGLRNLMSFLDGYITGPVPLDVEVSSRKYANELMLAEGLTMTSSIVEVDVSSSMNPIHGKIDLLYNSRSLDYKTGKYKGASDIIKGFKNSSNSYVEMQPMIYLALMKDSGVADAGTFSMFYLYGKDGRVMDEGFAGDSFVDVHLMRETKSESLGRPDSLVRKDFEGVKSYVDMYENWNSFIDPITYSGLPSEEWVGNASLIENIRSSMGYKSTKTHTKAIVGALNRLKKFLDEDYWIYGNSVYVPSDSMDKFLTKLKKDHEEATAMADTEFPPRPIKDCKKCNFASVCTREPVSIKEEGDVYE